MLLLAYFSTILLCTDALQYLDTTVTYYFPDDEVIILQEDILESLFYEVSTVWVLHVHKKDCKFCWKFAQVWKQVAIDFVGANDLIRFGEFDCAAQQHLTVNICQDIKTTKDTMMLKYYHENFLTNANDSGKTIQIDFNLLKMKEVVLNYVIYEMSQKRAKLFPKLVPFTSPNVTNLIEETKNDAKFIILIILQDVSTIGSEVMLNLHSITNVTIKYCYNNQTKLINDFKINKFPSLFIVSHDEIVKTKIIYVDKEKNLKNTIEKFLNQTLFNNVPTSTTKIIKLKEKHIRNDLHVKDEHIFLMDLETTVRYSFKNVIATFKTIENKQYIVLNDFIDVLLKYFPFTKKGYVFISELKQIIQNPNRKISGTKILHIFRGVERRHPDLFTSVDEWLTCDRDVPHYYQYFCGFWKLFHYFTIRASEIEIENNNYLKILLTMQNYVKYFINSNYTRNIPELIDSNFTNVNNYDNAILWLWSLHNTLNNKFSIEINQDPLYPKIQYPSIQACPQCRNVDNVWNMNEVLKYLKKMYSNYTFNENNSKKIFRDNQTSRLVMFLNYILHILLYFVIVCLVIAIVSVLIDEIVKKIKYSKK